jgi:hypothetical protein
VILEQQAWPTWLGEAEGDHAMLAASSHQVQLLRVWPLGHSLLERIAA